MNGSYPFTRREKREVRHSQKEEDRGGRLFLFTFQLLQAADMSLHKTIESRINVPHLEVSVHGVLVEVQRGEGRSVCLLLAAEFSCIIHAHSLRGPSAILFTLCDTCSDSLAKLFRACFHWLSHICHAIGCRMGYHTDVPV